MCNPTSSSPRSTSIITTMIDASLLHDLLIGPFVEFDFMRRALAGVLFLSLSAAPIGVLLMLRRMSLMGDAISHAVLPGLALAFLFTASRSSWPMFVGAAVVGLLTAVLTQVLSRWGRVDESASMGVVFTSPSA